MNHQASPFLLSSLSLLFAPLINASSETENNALWQSSYSDFGGVGLMQTPTARMADEGEFSFTTTLNQDYYHYSVSLQLMSWLETTIRYTRVPDVLYNQDASYSGDNIYTDKGIDFKVRILEESYWLPETSIGVRDFGGTGLFDAEYINATKRFGSVDLTLGLGWGYLGQSGNITNPFCKASDKYCDRNNGFKGTGGSVDFERWFKGPAALFGGIEYQTPHQPLRLKLEYEGNDYSDDFVNNQPDRTITQNTPWNVGVSYRLADWADIKLAYERGNTATFGMNLNTNFNDLSATWRDSTKIATELRPSRTITKNDDWSKVAKQLENNAGYKQNNISEKDNVITVTGEQKKYRDRGEALDRTAAILNNSAPAEIDTFKVIEKRNGITLTETTINREQYVQAANYMSLDGKIEDSFDTQAVSTSADNDKKLAQNYQRWDYSFDPSLKQTLGGPEAFYLYSLGINASSNYWLMDNLELSGSIYFNLTDNYDKYNYVEDSPHIRNHATPRVRTMFRAYVHDNPVRLNHLQLTWFEQPSENIYTQTYAGYLEMMFAGIGGEVLYRPLNSNWAIGIDANIVSQRDPDSWFGTFDEDYFYYDNYDASRCADEPWRCQGYVLSQGSTGHLTGYYMPEWSLLESTLFKVSAGKFLGGDNGVRVDFSKQFDSGVTVGAYATLTELTEEEYGEGSYNKGFYISIPFDIMTVKPSTSRANIAWQPITRDGGQMLNRKYKLFEVTDAKSTWYQRANSVK